MTNTELLKTGRDRLLGLHKSLVDLSRAEYEMVHGKVTSGQFLNALLDDADLSWLRKFSTLIVDIDEMFAQKDGFSDEAVDEHLAKLKELVTMSGHGDDFAARYADAVQRDLDVASRQGELRNLLS